MASQALFGQKDISGETLGKAAADAVYDMYPEAANSSDTEEQFFIGQTIASGALYIIELERELRTTSKSLIEFYPQEGEA